MNKDKENTVLLLGEYATLCKAAPFCRAQKTIALHHRSEKI